MKKKAPGFTLLELIIVIGIISVLFVAFRGLFGFQKKELLYGEACINNIRGNINNYITSAITSKSIYSGQQEIQPDTYYIAFDTIQNTTTLQYKSGTNTIQNYANYILSGSNTKQRYCNSSTYTLQLSGISTTVTINKGLNENTQLQNFYIDQNGTFQREIYLMLCMGTSCKELGKFTIDVRKQSIKKSLCISIDPKNGKCLLRNQ